MAKRLSTWTQRARARWPRSFRHGLIFGDARFAVGSCAFRDANGNLRYSEVRLIDALEAARELRTKVDKNGCRAGSECNRAHKLVDLLSMENVQNPEPKEEQESMFDFYEAKMGIDGL